MAKRVITKIGDIFFVDLENGNKKYFQYVANDRTQLNSDVIRVFRKEYPMRTVVSYTQLLFEDIDFHAHTMINVGVKLNLFHKEGKDNVFPDIGQIMFRDTNDYGHKVGEEPIKLSNNWFVWKINDEKFTLVGKLEGKNRMADIGVVIPPYAIVERIKTGKFNFFYPDFE